MRSDSLTLEAGRMGGLTVENYPWLHERHRLFPEIFENRSHKKIIDVSAGIGIVAKRITENYDCEMTCNEVDRTCLGQLQKLKANVVSFDLESGEPFPLENASFDAVVCLATLEHILKLDDFVLELKRILSPGGRLYLSVPNYASLYWMIPLLRGKTFHDPFQPRSRYEFYAHIRYFTYQTLLDFMKHFGFYAETVYLPLPKGSTKFKQIQAKSQILAFAIQTFFRFLYQNSARWHQEPVVCFRKDRDPGKIKKVIL